MKKLYILTFSIFSFFIACSVSAQVAFDASANLGNYDSGSETVSFTTSGTDRVLIIGSWSESTITSITYAGSSLSKLGTQQTIGSRVIDVWYLVNPTVGTNNLVFTWSSGNARFLVSSYTGVDQLDFPDAVNVGTETTETSFDLTITTDNPDTWLVAIAGATTGGTCEPGSGTTGRATDAGAAFLGDSNGILEGYVHLGVSMPTGSDCTGKILSIAPPYTEPTPPATSAWCTSETISDGNCFLGTALLEQTINLITIIISYGLFLGFFVGVIKYFIITS